MWKTEPFKEIPKTPKDELADILLDISTILEAHDLLAPSKPSEQKNALLLDFVQRCLEIGEQLQRWQHKHGTIDDLDKPPRTSLSEHEQRIRFARGHISMIYWSACTLVFATLRHAGKTVYPLDTLPSYTEPKPYASMIARSAPYFFEPHGGTFGPQAIAFPIGCATMQIGLIAKDGEEPEEKRILWELLSRPGLGKAMGKFLIALQRTSVHLGQDMGDMAELSGVDLGDQAWHGTRARSKFWMGVQAAKEDGGWEKVNAAA
jgi:hypothetical protein